METIKHVQIMTNTCL